jgi:hypothetical protein
MSIVLYQYTIDDAIRDGALIDVSKTAVKMGVLMPVALTEAVWQQYVEVSDYLDAAEERLTPENRLWDLLWMYRLAAMKDPKEDCLEFETLVKIQPGQSSCVILKAVISPSDTAIPVITIMTPDENLIPCFEKVKKSADAKRNKGAIWNKT